MRYSAQGLFLLFVKDVHSFREETPVRLRRIPVNWNVNQQFVNILANLTTTTSTEHTVTSYDLEEVFNDWAATAAFLEMFCILCLILGLSLFRF
jgi:hypothetical protein